MNGAEAVANAASSKGECYVCGAIVAKNGMLRHLRSCMKKHLPPPGANASAILHLRIEGRDAPQYWLHVEAPASGYLDDLDSFLRNIWLECCGHLSAFTVLGSLDVQVKPGKVFMEWTSDGGFDAEPSSDWDQMDALFPEFAPRPQHAEDEFTIGEVLAAAPKLLYEYDFGSTTELVVSKVGERMGALQDDVVWLLARNNPPQYTCERCSSPAQTVYSDGFEMWLGCRRHPASADGIEDGEEDEETPVAAGPMDAVIDEDTDEDEYGEGTLPVVNSPRAGVCAFCTESDDMPRIEVPPSDELAATSPSADTPKRAAKPAKASPSRMD